MYIKSMVIDGFKSYAQRTEVNGFDALFNAITGLNGSGKSNILDAICFLLGITNLSQVRATNLQELVYKNGQAGVTKATVSITFDNMDKKQSPLGYEQFDEITVTRQVVMGGRNRYLINGSNANNTRVQDMFRSVQLNINNPHFLIMQGRITKVLNMKPPEILSMIEEAAGTRLYESKKESAQKTIEKKDMKLQEIDRILKEDITPTLTKLKEERSSYLEYQKVIRELEHLNKLYVAFQFVCAEKTKQKSTEELVEMQKSIEICQQKQTELTQKIQEYDEIIANLEKARDAEAGGSLQSLEAALGEIQKADTKIQSVLSNKKETLKSELKKQKELQKLQSSDEATLKGKKTEVERITSVLDQLQKQYEADSEAHVAAQQNFQAVSAGLSNAGDGQAASLQDQLINAEKTKSKAESDMQEAQMRLKHAQQEVKRKQSDLKKTGMGYQKQEEKHRALLKTIQKIEAEIEKLSYQEGTEEKLLADKQKISSEVRNLTESVDTLEAKFPHLQFNYTDPEKNFDRRKVHGLVARLIKVKDERTATALEVSAGGKLYNVVVDTQVTGQKILERGNLKRRYTIIPLNKISAHAINKEVVKRAESLVGKNNVQTALSLVGYEEELTAAMEYVFGNAFVCKDMDTAKKVTYDPKVMKKSVTLGGDSFDPTGTLTGGARLQGGNVLAKLTELKMKQDDLEDKRLLLQQVEAELTSIRRIAARWRELKQQLDVNQQESRGLEEQLAQSTHGQQLQEVQALEAAIKEHEEVLVNAKEIKEQTTAQVKDLQYKVKNAKSLREKELKEAEVATTKAKKGMEQSQKKMKEKQIECESLQLEAKDLEKDINGYTEQLSAVAEAVKGYEEQIEEMQETVANSKAEVKKAQEALNQQKEKLKSCNREIAAKQSEQQQMHKEMNKADLLIQEVNHKVTKVNKDSNEATKQVEYLLEKHEWIVDEKAYFGQPNTAYDFDVNNPKEANKRIQNLQSTKDKLSKSVNMRAMNMLGKAEEQYNDLMKKRKIVLSDKMKIVAVIAELDEKKNEAVKKAHLQVNKDFGSIFSTLLPGTQAKLVPSEGRSILDGLEVKVAFGDVWKESLGELSGGQRSLVALSLILSLLLFKPAPLYILDEVDAALDLSHTQNIGQMLRTHFKQSQFIVVSLKDGMFNNANVLFKTKFVDGISTVTRYVQQQSSRLPSASTSNNTKKNTAKRPRVEEQPLAAMND